MESEEQRSARILRTILDDNDRKIYALIKQHPSTKKDLAQRTKFPSSLLDKILKQLVSYNLIRSIKRPESKNMNVWVLSTHQEQEEAHLQFDEKDDLMDLVRKKEGSIAFGQLQKEATRKGIKVDNLQQILTIMELRGEIHISNGKIIKRTTQLINAPCVECNLKDICHPGGSVSPTTCPYLLSW